MVAYRVVIKYKSSSPSNLTAPTSVKKSLNINQVKYDEGGAYSDVRDSINSMMLQQGPLNSLEDILNQPNDGVVTSIVQSLKLQKIGNEMKNEAIMNGKDPKEIVPQIVFIWDDGFDTTDSKSGTGGGLSMGTLTALDLKTGNMSRLRSQTDVITLSRSTADHDKTIGRVMSQLRELRKPFRTFHKTLGEVWCMVRVVNVNRDRVQRNKVSGVLAHNGRCNQRWKYVLPPKGDARDSFYSCNECFERRVKACAESGPIDSNLNATCGICCDFDVDKNIHLQTVEIPKKCPTQVIPGSPKPPPIVPISTTNRRRSSFKMKYKHMRMAVRTAAYHRIIRFWDEEATTAYLKEVGINTSVIEGVLLFQRRNNHRDPKDVIDDLEICDYNNLIPCVWQYDDVCDIDENIDPLMHMLFEGIVKVMFKEVIPHTLTLFKVHDMDCMDTIQDQLRSIRKMSLSWVRTENWRSRL